MSVIRFVILEDSQKSLETTIDFLLNEQEYCWDKIYLFSAFVKKDGVEKVKKILVHPSLKENTEVLIATGKKDTFNDPSDIQNLLKFIDEESTNIKTKSVSFICPIHNFHIKAYCFLGRRVRDNKEIGFSIIGSSNLTGSGLKCEGELCISIHHLNLTKDFIYRFSSKYRKSPPWYQEIM
jgi:HKD family nuclease